MGLYVVNKAGKEMETSHSSSSKTERKIVEKNRRNQMKNLYSNLNSLLPTQTSKEPLSLPDQIDEAINYIKMLQTKLEKTKEKKESLTSTKRSYTCTSEVTVGLKSPQIEIHEVGTSLEVILATGLDNQIIFYEIIRMLHEECAEVVNASFSIVGNSILHVIHAEIGDLVFGFGAARISTRLKQFVLGSTSEVEFQPELWDFDIRPEMWEC